MFGNVITSSLPSLQCLTQEGWQLLFIRETCVRKKWIEQLDIACHLSVWKQATLYKSQIIKSNTMTPKWYLSTKDSAHCRSRHFKAVCIQDSDRPEKFIYWSRLKKRASVFFTSLSIPFQRAIPVQVAGWQNHLQWSQGDPPDSPSHAWMVSNISQTKNLFTRICRK